MVDIDGRVIQMTLICRRSKNYAGARFLKRGLNEQGHVANDVETEQLICDSSPGFTTIENMTSFVQHRGSIPLYWGQYSNGVMPKPPITSMFSLFDRVQFTGAIRSTRWLLRRHA